MSFRISGLSPAPFRHLFGLSDAELAAHNVRRFTASSGSGMPDRVELRDAREGETVLLVNYEHQPAPTPFRASHAIYVIEGGGEQVVVRDRIPPALRSRLLSIRAFDAAGMMIDADVVDGAGADTLIARLLANPATSYLQAHYARFGCYAALIERAS